MFIYKKMKYFNLVLITLFILFNGNRFYFAQESTQFAQDTTKIKVLVLHIIEENWDDLELNLPKYKIGRDGRPKPVTKKDALQNYKEYKGEEENLRVKENRAFRGFKKEITTVAEEKQGAIGWIKFLLKEGNITKETKLRIDHDIRYYGKTYLLKDEETFMKDAFRLGGGKAGYVYEKIPEKISILTEGPKVFSAQYKKFTPPIWYNFTEIRLVEDIYILSNDEMGNLKIRYDGNEYNLNAKSILELPVKEADLTKEEMMKFREKYYEYYTQKYNELWMGQPEGNFFTQLSDLSITKETFHFSTKIIIVNNGYVEAE